MITSTFITNYVKIPIALKQQVLSGQPTVERLLQNTRIGAGVYHDMGSHKVVAWSFPLEIIEGRDDMRKVFKKSMDFLE